MINYNNAKLIDESDQERGNPTLTQEFEPYRKRAGFFIF